MLWFRWSKRSSLTSTSIHLSLIYCSFSHMWQTFFRATQRIYWINVIHVQHCNDAVIIIYNSQNNCKVYSFVHFRSMNFSWTLKKCQSVKCSKALAWMLPTDMNLNQQKNANFTTCWFIIHSTNGMEKSITRPHSDEENPENDAIVQ